MRKQDIIFKWFLDFFFKIYFVIIVQHLDLCSFIQAVDASIQVFSALYRVNLCLFLT